MGLKTKLSVTALGFAAIALAGLTLLPFEQAKSVLDLTAPDGNADQFDTFAYNSARVLLGIYAAACAAMAMTVWFFHNKLAEHGLAQASLRIRTSWSNFVRETKPVEWVVLFVIFMIGALARWMSLELPMHSDECWTYLNYVSRNLIHIAAQYDSPNNHVLHNLFAWFTTTLLGDTTFAIRIPAFFAGVTCLPLAYWLAYRQGNRHVAMLAMALVAAWPMLVDYSANARGYSMITAGTLALVIAADAIRREGHATAYGAFAIICALGLYTIPSFAISIITGGLWLVLVIAMERDFSRFTYISIRLTITAVVAIALTLVLYAPIIAINGVDAILSNDVVTGEQAGVDSIIIRIADVWQDWQQGIPLALQLGVIVGFIAAFLVKGHELRTLWLALLCAATLISVAQGTVGPSRIWMFALPLCLIFAALGTLLWWPYRRQYQASIAISLGVLVLFATAYLRQPGHALYTEFGEFAQAEALTEQIENTLQAEDGLATMFPANRTINWYARQSGVIQKVSNARQNFRNNTFKRLLIVAPSETTPTDTLAWNDTLNETSYASRQRRVLQEIDVSGATLSIIEFAED